MDQKQRKHEDRHLGVPADANQDHHINFPKVEEESAGTLAELHNADVKRQEQWKQGLKEGRKMHEQQNGDEQETS